MPEQTAENKFIGEGCRNVRHWFTNVKVMTPLSTLDCWKTAAAEMLSKS